MRRRAAQAMLAAALTFSGPIGAKAQSPAELWSGYKNRFISSEGRLSDDSAGGISHSEGQGYGMLLAAFSDDRDTFAKMWDWTSTNLEVRSDALAGWRWRPQDNPRVMDRNNATDGDLLIAWALAEAGKRWKEPKYTKAARKIGLAIAEKATYASIFGPALSPGVAGYGADDMKDGPVVNLSYWVFPAFDALAEVAPEYNWASLRDSGLALIDAARFGPRKLPTDWISLKFGVQPAANYPRQFGYDVVRAPLYLAWGVPKERDRLAAMVDAWAGPTDGTPDVIETDKGGKVYSFGDKGYRAVAALARCAAHGTKFPDELRSIQFDRYYSATLHMLSLTALRLRYPQC